MPFSGLGSDSGTSTTDYIFCADVTTGNDCEGDGHGQRPLHAQSGRGAGNGKGRRKVNLNGSVLSTVKNGGAKGRESDPH